MGWLRKIFSTESMVPERLRVGELLPANEAYRNLMRLAVPSVLEMVLKALPEVVKNAAEPLAQTDKIVMYGDGNATKVVRDVMNSANQIMEGMRESTGIDLQQLIAGLANRDSAPKDEA